MISGGTHAPPNLRGQDPRRLVYPSEPILTLSLSSCPSFHARSHSSLNPHPNRGLAKESTSCCCRGMAEARDYGDHEQMHTRPDKETDLDSSGARFEAVDLNGGWVDEEATWFCSDVMADVAGRLEFRSAAGTRSVSNPTLPPSISPLDVTNRSPDIAFGRNSTMISQDNAVVESDGSSKKRVVCPPSPPSQNWLTAESLDSVTSLTQISPDSIMVRATRPCS